MEEDAFKENMNGNKREVHCRKAKKKKKKNELLNRDHYILQPWKWTTARKGSR